MTNATKLVLIAYEPMLECDFCMIDGVCESQVKCSPSVYNYIVLAIAALSIFIVGFGFTGVKLANNYK